MVFTAAAQQKEDDDDKLVFDTVSTQQMLGDRVKSALWGLTEANRQESTYA